MALYGKGEILSLVELLLLLLRTLDKNLPMM